MVNVILVCIFSLHVISFIVPQNVYRHVKADQAANQTDLVLKVSTIVTICYLKTIPIDIVSLDLRDCNLMPLIPYKERTNVSITIPRPNYCFILTGDVNIALRTIRQERNGFNPSGPCIEDFCSTKFRLGSYHITGIQLIKEVCNKIYISSEKESLRIEHEVIFTCLVKNKSNKRDRRGLLTAGEIALRQAYLDSFDNPSPVSSPQTKPLGRMGGDERKLTPKSKPKPKRRFRRLDGDGCSYRECVVGNFVTDSMVWHVSSRTAHGWTEVSIALFPGYMIKNSLNLTFNQENPIIVNMDEAIPHDDTLTTFTIMGEYLTIAMEHGLLNKAPVAGKWPYLQVAGIRKSYISLDDPDERMLRLEVRCSACFIPDYQSLHLTTRYAIVAPTELAQGAAGYSVLRLHQNDTRVLPNSSVKKILADYLTQNTMLFPDSGVRLVKNTMLLKAPRTSTSFLCLFLALLLQTHRFLY